MSTEPEGEAPPGVPRWVLVFAAIAIVLVLLFAGLHLAGIGMGPAMHGAPAGGR